MFCLWALIKYTKTWHHKFQRWTHFSGACVIDFCRRTINISSNYIYTNEDMKNVIQNVYKWNHSDRSYARTYEITPRLMPSPMRTRTRTLTIKLMSKGKIQRVRATIAHKYTRQTGIKPNWTKWRGMEHKKNQNMSHEFQSKENTHAPNLKGTVWKQKGKQIIMKMGFSHKKIRCVWAEQLAFTKMLIFEKTFRHYFDSLDEPQLYLNIETIVRIRRNLLWNVPRLSLDIGRKFCFAPA